MKSSFSRHKRWATFAIHLASPLAVAAVQNSLIAMQSGLFNRLANTNRHDVSVNSLTNTTCNLPA
jgi:hypothetical protein